MGFFWGVSDSIRPGPVARVGAAPTTLPAHPRIWMTPTRLTQLQLQKTNNTTRWQTVKTMADGQVALGSTYSSSDHESLSILGMAYLATNNVAYATRAALILTNFCIASNQAAQLQTDSGFYYRTNLHPVAVAFDWCYSQLSVALRRQVATWLLDAADWVWPESNASRANAWAVNDPGNNYYYGFCMSALAALAGAGDDTGTGVLSGSDRATFHQNLFTLNKWANHIVPYIATGQATYDPFVANGSSGGIFSEGTNYGPGSSANLSLVLDAYATCNISLTNSWLADVVRATLHFTAPDFVHRIPFGDQALNAIGAPVFREDIMQVRDVMTPDATLSSQAQLWLNTVGIIPGPGSYQYVGPDQELLRFNPTLTAATDFSALPLSLYAAGPGNFIYRDSWTDPTTLLFAFDCGCIESGHHPKSANSIMIWVNGQWLSCNANIYSNSGINQATTYFNTMTGGVDWSGIVGQRSNGTNGDGNGGRIIAAPSVASNLVWLRGQAFSAYGSHNVPFSSNRVRNIPNYIRVAVYLPLKRTFIIVDQITLLDGTQPVIEYWHTKNAGILGTQQFTLNTPDNSYHGYTDILLPSGVVLSNVAQNLGSGNTLSSYAVNVAFPSGSTTHLIVTTIQISNAASRPYVVSASSNGTNVTAIVDTSTVTIPLDGTSNVTIA